MDDSLAFFIGSIWSIKSEISNLPEETTHWFAEQLLYTCLKKEAEEGKESLL